MLSGGGLGDFWAIIKAKFGGNVFPVDSSHIAPNGT